MTTVINGLKDIIYQYDTLLIDIFGVVHNGIELFPHTVETFQFLNDHNKHICLLSNSPRRANGAAKQIASLGLARDAYHHIVTSGEYTRDMIADGQFGKRCLMYGTPIMREVLYDTSIDIVHAPQDADFVLNAAPDIHPHYKDDFYNDLKQCIDLNLPMVCSNPDLIVAIGNDTYECAGTFAKFYADNGGHVTYIGKPYAPVYDRCFELLNAPDKARTCVIGDSFHTDIAGANGYGIDSILNITGIHEHDIDWHNDAARSTYFGEQIVQPTYVMHGLQP